MEPWVKRLLALPVIVLAMLCLVVVLGSAQADNDSHRDEADQTLLRFGLDYVPLRGEKVDMAVRTVLLRHDGKTYALTTRRGMEVKSQNRLPLGRVPLIGPLTDPPYERDSFAAKNEVADVTADGEQLFINLPRSMPLPAGVVIFNQTNAFFLSGKPKAGVAEVAFAEKTVGSAFYDPQEKKLLIMVRPLVILDSAFF